MHVIFFFIVTLGGGTLWPLQKILQCIKYIILEFTPSTSLLFPLTPPVPGMVSTGIICAFTCMCTHFLYCIHRPTHFPCHPSFPTGTNHPSPGQDLFSDFVEEKENKKKMTFLLI
jgi:hypothetical protein